MKKNQIEGTVIKVTKQEVVLLCKDGSFRNVPRSSTEEVPLIGAHHCYIEKKRTWPKYFSMVSILLLAVVTYMLFPYTVSSSKYVVAIDINPSVELVVNDKLIVEDVFANNLDGDEMLASLDVKGKDLTFAIENILTYAILSSFDDHSITTAIIALDEENIEIVGKIEELISTTITESQEDISLEITKTNKLVYEEAKSNDMSVPALNVSKQLQSEGIISSIDEVRGKSIGEIRNVQNNKVNENSKEQPPHSNGNKQGENKSQGSKDEAPGQKKKQENEIILEKNKSQGKGDVNQPRTNNEKQKENNPANNNNLNQKNNHSNQQLNRKNNEQNRSGPPKQSIENKGKQPNHSNSRNSD